MASILTDPILNKLLCSTCKQYLSCGPTKVDADGSISCGRCNTSENAITNSLYDKVSSHLLFPCVNRYEGCNKLLQFKDVSQHEKVCRGTKFSCPLCPFDPSNRITLLFLIDHYKSAHGEYFLKEPNFLIDPEVMSENVYLYCDNVSNCVFLIKVSCTQDRITLNACVPEKNTVTQRFRLNNIFELPIKEVLCNSWEKEENQYLEASILDVLSGQDEQILCEFFYEILEKKTLTVVMDSDSIDEPNRDEKLRKLPKLYLDRRYFPGYNTYKISPCGSKLICVNDPNNVIQLKCDVCDTSFWNVRFRRASHKERKDWHHILDSVDLIHSQLLICAKCYNYYGYRKTTPVFNSPTLKLKVCCRYNCGKICCIWEIYGHEWCCDFNFEKDAEAFIKTCFKNITFNDDDKFVRGNCIEPFKFEVAFYAFEVHGTNPEIPNGKLLTSQERIIYGVTDDGYKYKVYYKYAEGFFMVRVEHDNDPSKYIVIIRTIEPNYNRFEEVMCLEQSNFSIISTISMKREESPLGISLICTSPAFFLIIEKIKSQFTVL